MKGLKKRLKVEAGINKMLLVEHGITEKQNQQQQQSFYNLMPVEPEAEPRLANFQQEVLQHNFNHFTTLLESWSKGAHCFNDISQFANVPVLLQGWSLGGPDQKWLFRGFTPSRNIKIDSQSKIEKFKKLFTIVDFSQHSPILFDREWRIIDGFHRYYAICNLDSGLRKRFYFMQLDF